MTTPLLTPADYVAKIVSLELEAAELRAALAPFAGLAEWFANHQPMPPGLVSFSTLTPILPEDVRLIGVRISDLERVDAVLRT